MDNEQFKRRYTPIRKRERERERETEEKRRTKATGDVEVATNDIERASPG